MSLVLLTLHMIGISAAAHCNIPRVAQSQPIRGSLRKFRLYPQHRRTMYCTSTPSMEIYTSKYDILHRNQTSQVGTVQTIVLVPRPPLYFLYGRDWSRVCSKYASPRASITHGNSLVLLPLLYSKQHSAKKMITVQPPEMEHSTYFNWVDKVCQYGKVFYDLQELMTQMVDSASCIYAWIIICSWFSESVYICTRNLYLVVWF